MSDFAEIADSMGTFRCSSLHNTLPVYLLCEAAEVATELESAPNCTTPYRTAPSPKGSWLAWRRAHLPQIDALLRGDMETYRDVGDRRAALEEIYAERAVFCHALMIHQMAGVYACPYERARVHDHARKALVA